MKPIARNTPRHARGLSLVEALVTLCVLTVGALLAVKLQLDLRLHADTARQRTEAVRLAQQDIETLRAFASIGSAGSPATASYDGIASTTIASGRYTLERSIVELPGHRAKQATLQVRWNDPRGAPQQVRLQTLIAASDPLHAAARGLPQTP